MKFSDLSKVSPFGPQPGLHLGLTERNNLQSSVRLFTSAHMTFDQFVTPANVLGPSMYLFLYLLVFTFFLFALDLGTKFLKKMNKKTTNKTFVKNILLLFSLVLC